MTLFIGAALLAGFAMLIRVLADGLGGMHAHWQDMMIIMAVLSMAIGNVVAIAQSNIKRMLAYSTIAHAGFMFLGLILAPQRLTGPRYFMRSPTPSWRWAHSVWLSY